MTAEIAIMNKQGVALAADSAVTVEDHSHPDSYRENRSKTFNAVNKLFMLSDEAPVGLMVFGGAEVTGLPWETAVKAFRSRLGLATYDYLELYLDEFLLFLEGTPELFPRSEQETDFLRLVSSYFNGKILASIRSRVGETIEVEGFIKEGQVRAIVNQSIREVHLELGSEPMLSGFDASYEAKLKLEYSSQIDLLIGEIFEKLPIGKTNRDRLEQISAMLMTRNIWPETKSGIVVAGFGEKEYKPSIIQCDVQGVACDRVKYIKDIRSTVTSEDYGQIFPFAQREMVDLFMTGIDPFFNDEILSGLSQIFQGLPATLLATMTVDAPTAERLQTALSVAATEIPKQFEKAIDEYARERHISPILQAVAVLPKEGLAEMAESLVNLTSFKRKVTLDLETVGGPIDVAVISKGDGFVWIKRKHYFEAERNPHFMARYIR